MPPLRVGGNSRHSDIDVEVEVSSIAAGFLGPCQEGRLLALDEFADASLLHLAEGIARKLIDDQYLLRNLEPGKALACQCPQRLRVGGPSERYYALSSADCTDCA